MEITTTITTPTGITTGVSMPTCGHAFDLRTTQVVSELNGGSMRIRVQADSKGLLAFAPAYTRGYPAWSPPLS